MYSYITILSVFMIGACLTEVSSYRLGNSGNKGVFGRTSRRLGHGKDLNKKWGRILRPSSRPQPTSLNEAIVEFSIALFKEAKPVDQKNGNKFISPYSVLAALMFTMLGTGGNTEKQLMSTLQLNRIQTNNIHREYKIFQDHLNNLSKNVTLAIANRMFPRLGVHLNQQYKLYAKRYYDSDVETLDFLSNPESSRLRINEWAKKKTNNIIKEILPKGAINPQVIMVLLNAIYFKGDWKIQFDKTKTAKKDFYISATRTEKVNMMMLETDEYRSGINKHFDCKILEMPYKGNKVSMVLILPNKIGGLPDLEKRLSWKALTELYSSLKKQKTKISIPKFKMLSSFKLKEPLYNLGIRDLFDPTAANFSGMFNDPSGGVHVSKVLHKAFVSVDEEGTEAAAVTAVIISKSASLTFRITVNHPFLFLIRENISGTILFIGRYTRPPK